MTKQEIQERLQAEKEAALKRAQEIDAELDALRSANVPTPRQILVAILSPNAYTITERAAENRPPLCRIKVPANIYLAPEHTQLIQSVIGKIEGIVEYEYQ